MKPPEAYHLGLRAGNRGRTRPTGPGGGRRAMHDVPDDTLASPGPAILILPNILPVVIVIFSINVGGVIISEASLSFLGFGLPPSVPSWGAMLSREGREYMQQVRGWLSGRACA